MVFVFAPMYKKPCLIYGFVLADEAFPDPFFFFLEITLMSVISVAFVIDDGYCKLTTDVYMI